MPAAFEEAIQLSSTNNRYLDNELFALATQRVRIINLFNASHPALLHPILQNLSRRTQFETTTDALSATFRSLANLYTFFLNSIAGETMDRLMT